MKSWIFIGLLISILCGGAYYYYTTTQETIQTLIANNSTMKSDITRLNEANNQNLNTIDKLQTEYTRIQDNFNALERDFQEIRSQTNLLREKFDQRDLNELALEKPKTIERVVNNASDKSLRCFEILSGSPLTEDEKNAENETQFNSECPWLWFYP